MNMKLNKLITRSIAVVGLACAVHAQGSSFQIRAAEILLGDGTRIGDGVLLIEEGRIRKVGRGVEVDPALPLVEHDGVLTAGLVACQTQSGVRGGASDSTRSIMPDARVADSLDTTHGDLEKALEAGITAVVLSPGPSNVVGGYTAVVKTTGKRVSDQAHLSLSFSRQALTPGNGRPAEVESTSSGTRRGLRFPTSYSGATAELNRLFGEGEGVYGAAKRGELPVLIEAWHRNEVARAAGFASRHGLTGAIRGATLATDLVEPLRASGLGVVLGPFQTAQASHVVESVRALGDAGVPMAFALDGPAFDPQQMRLSAAMAVALGADPAVTMRALTSDAARIAGVAERLGSIERGRDADLVLWSGDPLNLTSRVEAVYVDGALVHRGDSQ